MKNELLVGEVSWQLSDVPRGVAWLHVNSWNLGATNYVYTEAAHHSGGRKFGVFREDGKDFFGYWRTSMIFFPMGLTSAWRFCVLFFSFSEVIMTCCTAALYFRRGTLHSILPPRFPTAYETRQPILLTICCLNNNIFGASVIQAWCIRKVLTQFKILRRLFWWIAAVWGGAICSVLA